MSLILLPAIEHVKIHAVIYGSDIGTARILFTFLFLKHFVSREYKSSRELSESKDG